MKKLLLLLLLSTTSYSQLRVAIVDSGLDLNDPRFAPLLCHGVSKDLTNTTIKDMVGHGTHVAGLVKQYAGKSNYCLIIIKYYAPYVEGAVNVNNTTKAFEYAVKMKATIINYSSGGSMFNQGEYNAIKSNPSVTFVVSAGNESANLDEKDNEYYPASYRLKNIIAVGSKNDLGYRSSTSNYASWLVWEYGEYVLSTLPGGMGIDSGTSMATAIHTGKLINSLR